MRMQASAWFLFRCASVIRIKLTNCISSKTDWLSSALSQCYDKSIVFWDPHIGTVTRTGYYSIVIECERSQSGSSSGSRSTENENFFINGKNSHSLFRCKHRYQIIIENRVVLFMLLRETMMLSKMSINEMRSDNGKYSKYRYHVIGPTEIDLHNHIG